MAVACLNFRCNCGFSRRVRQRRRETRRAVSRRVRTARRSQPRVVVLHVAEAKKNRQLANNQNARHSLSSDLLQSERCFPMEAPLAFACTFAIRPPETFSVMPDTNVEKNYINGYNARETRAPMEPNKFQFWRAMK